MEEFYIDVKLDRGIIRFQVNEVPFREWDKPYAPQFIVEFYNGTGFTTLTLQLEQGKWYDRNTRLSEEDHDLRYFEPGPNTWDVNYQSPFSGSAIQQIGHSIARHMVVQLTAYMGLFIPAFPHPTLS